MAETNIETAINKTKQNVANAYAVLYGMGAEPPAEETSGNLAATAGTVKVVRYDAQTLTDAQKAQARANTGAASSEEVNSLSKEIADKADKSGWDANKYLGTDATGNIVVKEAPDGTGKTAFDTFIDNTDVDYDYDADAHTFYSVIRVNKTKVDGAEQYPFVYCNGVTYDDKISAYNVAVKEGFFIVINAGIFSTTNGKPDGVNIQNGVVITNEECELHPGSMPLTIDGNGNLGYAAYNADANELVANGIISAVCGFMPIVVDYVAVPSSEWNDVDHYTEGAQRQIIGQWGNGDYAIITCEGRDFHNSIGWTIEQAQNICVKLGLKFAYNLDGGGSTETVIGLKQINSVYENSAQHGRRVATHIVFNGKTTFKNPGATAVPVYTNLVPTAIDTDKSIFNGVGYMDGYRLSSSKGTTSAQAGSTVTGFIRANPTDILRISGVKFGSKDSADTQDGYVNVGFYCNVTFYDVNFNYIDVDGTKAYFQYDGWKTMDKAGGTYPVKLSYDAETGVTTIDYSGMTTISDMAYIRINAAGNGADMIVTLNEPIT